MNVAEKIEEEVLDKYKVEDKKRNAYIGRGLLSGMVGKNFRFVQRI